MISCRMVMERPLEGKGKEDLLWRLCMCVRGNDQRGSSSLDSDDFFASRIG